MAVTLAAAARKAEADATAGLLNSGKIYFMTGAAPDPDAALSGTTVATMTFGATAFNTATDDGTNATAVATSIASVTASKEGTISYFRWTASSGTSIAQGDVSTIAAGTGDIQLSSTTIVAGTVLFLTALNYQKSQT